MKCKFCESTNHYGFQCFKRPRKPVSKSLRTKTWLKVRQEWFKQNHQESYNCHYCGRFLYRNQVELDHFLSRSRRPDLKYELSNLVPSCHMCNTEKGSLSGDQYLEKRRGND